MSLAIVIEKVLEAREIPYRGPEPEPFYRSGYDNVFKFTQELAEWVLLYEVGYVAVVHSEGRQSEGGAWYSVPVFTRE